MSQPQNAFTDLISPRPASELKSAPEILTAYAQSASTGPYQSEPLPTILCLHGGGTSARIFRFQLRNLTNALKNHFNFIFIDAPVASPPGPGVLPYFESVPPYWRWVWNVGKEGSGSETEWKEVKGQVAPRLKIALDKVKSEGWGPIVGAVGFSQGCRMAAGLLLRQTMLRHKGEDNDELDLDLNLRFGVFVGGGWPPIYFTPPPHPNLTTGTEEQTPVTKLAEEELITVPTIHAWGRDDPQKVAARALIEKATKGFGMGPEEYEFAGGHHMPMVMSESRELSDRVLNVWRECERKGQGNGFAS